MKNLKKEIRKKLIETKRDKEDLLIESAIVESRILTIADKKTLSNFNNLKKSDQIRIADELFVEMIQLNNLGLMTEEVSFSGILKSIFGQSLSGVWQMILERMVNYLLTALGMEDGVIKKILVSYISSHPIDAIKSLGDCKLMTKLLVEATIEGLIMEYKQSQGWTGVFADTLRNSVLEAIKNEETVKKLTDALTDTVCDLVDKLMGNAKGVLSSLQSKPAAATT